MFIEFTVGNYRSFLEPVTLSLEAANLRAESKEVDGDNVIEANDLRLLKVAGIYGANASGKSNLIRALYTMQRIVENSSRQGQIGDSLPSDPFLLQQGSGDRPSFLEIVVADSSTQYRYGFEIDAKKVHREWLYRRPRDRSREHRLFLRQDSNYRLHKEFGEGRDLRTKTRQNALFLSVCAQFDGEIAKQVMGCFENLDVINGLEDSQMPLSTASLINSADPQIVELVQRFDVGITNLELQDLDEFIRVGGISKESLPKEFRENLEDAKVVQTSHQVFDEDGELLEVIRFSMGEESEGTQKLIRLAGPIILALRNGSTLIIDEFEARLHSTMSLEIVRLFQSEETNPNNAQLVFTSHDTNLMQRSLFRRDQLWFVEKHPKGWSDLFSLAEIRLDNDKKVRNDARFEKDYLQGRYGAVPFLGNLHASVANAMRVRAIDE